MKVTRTLRTALIFAAIGLITAVFVIYSLRKVVSTYEQDLPLMSLGDRVKGIATRAQLDLESLLAGDKSINFDNQVRAQFSACQRILQGAYDGKETALGKFATGDDEELKALLKEAIIDVEELSTASAALLAANQPPAIQNMDSADSLLKATENITIEKPTARNAFIKFVGTADRLTVYITKKVNQDRQVSVFFHWLTVLTVLGGFFVLCGLAYQVLSKNDKVLSESSSKLEAENKRVETLSGFIESVSTGNYNIDLKAHDDDSLTGTLIAMRNKLKQNAEDDFKRNWSTQGLAQIGEILRATTSTSSELYDNIIRFMVKYTKSNQGGLFIINDDEEGQRYLELVACYAFERKKYLEKKVTIGDGLVGQCFLEGERIYLTEVPQEYVSITSGLGGSNPSSLLIVPMRVNEKTFGVIELASFNRYQEFEIEFIEKLAESIASTIANVRVNETTRILLEKTQQQAEEMKSQEEEIRQNMEELEATQEEMRRKQTVLERELSQSQQQANALKLQEQKLTESQDTLQAIVDNIPRAIFWKDNDLRFMGCNIIFARVAGVASPRDLIGKTDFDMAWSAQADAYRKDDHEVMRSRKPKLDIEEVNVNSAGEESWVRTSKVPIISQAGEVVAILGMFEDITAWKRKEVDVAQKLKEREEALKELRELRQMLES
jgi:PAS domain S-box-containing protein